MVRLVLALLLSLLVLPAQAARVALLIGNDTYDAPSLALKNPVNDVNALARRLEDLSFRVKRLTNADLAETRKILAEFEAESAGAEMSLVFFAGHGVQIEGENHLLTAGFGDLTLSEVEREAVTLSEIRAAVQRARPRIGMILIDACRDNPFSQTGATERGLARSQGGAGILIAYATDPGNVAYDGEEQNSLFTQALLDHVAAPDLDVRLMFGRVRQQVVLRSAGRQIPWVEEAVLGEHVLNPEAQTVPIDTALQKDLEAWARATGAGTAEAYRAYLGAMPEGMFRPFADRRVRQLSDTGGHHPVAIPAGRIARLIAATDRRQLTAALKILGFLAPDAQATDAQIEPALSAYAAQLSADGEVRLDVLYREAAWSLATLGGTTAQRLRTDLAALSGIDRTQLMAEGAVRELAELARTNAEAKALLEASAQDIAAIRTARDMVLARLDGSRDYYATLLAAGRQHFQPELAATLARMETRGGAARDRGLEANARIFISHALGGRAGADGNSVSWLSDFLPGG